MSRNSSGKRLSFEIHQTDQGDLYVSRKIFTDPGLTKMCRLHIDKERMEFRIVDAVTGAAYVEGGGVSNEEVLFRKAKRTLKKFLGIEFTKEERNAGRFKK